MIGVVDEEVEPLSVSNVVKGALPGLDFIDQFESGVSARVEGSISVELESIKISDDKVERLGDLHGETIDVEFVLNLLENGLSVFLVSFSSVHHLFNVHSISVPTLAVLSVHVVSGFCQVSSGVRVGSRSFGILMS